jgi:hypothetical protein
MIGSQECVYEKYTSRRCHVSEGSSGRSIIAAAGVPLDIACAVEGLRIDSCSFPRKSLNHN